MITFLSQPETIQPVYSNLVFQFQSTAATDPSYYRYRYVVDVYTQDGQIAQLKITPSTEGWGQVDLSPILMNYTATAPVNIGCSGETPIHEIAWGYIKDNQIVYNVMIGEEYATSITGIVEVYTGYGNVGFPAVPSDTCYATNGVKEWFNGKSYNFEPYYLTGSTGVFPQLTSRFLTNSPRTRYIREGDYAVMAALNWYDATTDLPARQIYSSLFSFYDISNNLISTGRTYNVESLCGTRPFCNYYDRFWDLPTNWAEEQVVYIGVGTPNLAAHGINYPSNTKYYSVQLEATSSQPTPPEPEIDTFSGCSCNSYSGFNDGGEVYLTYLDCETGIVETLFVDADTPVSFCACQNTIRFTSGVMSFDNMGACPLPTCITYELYNNGHDPEFFYDDCNGVAQVGYLPDEETIVLCAAQDTIDSDAFSITTLGACPLPDVIECATYLVESTSFGARDITYTGCCNEEISFRASPFTLYTLCAKVPFPTTYSSLVVVSASTCTPDPCPEPPSPTPPSPEVFAWGAALQATNLCDGSTMFFRYTGDTIDVGQYINYENTAYLITGVGGAAFIDVVLPYVFNTEEEALAAFPCPIYTSGSCLSTTIISEPFYYYVDDICSAGDRVIFFVNKMGTWDSYNFRAKEDSGYSVNKQVYQAAPTLYAQGWDSSSYSGWNSQRRVWNQQVIKSGILYTDFMPQAESIWLSDELFQSPSVYMVNDDGILEPIVITNTEVAVPNYQINSNKYQIQIEYQSGYNTIRQNHE
jgi:hypothetical protein